MEKENEKLITIIYIILFDMFVLLGQVFLLFKLNGYLINNLNRFIFPIVSVGISGLFIIFDFIIINHFINLSNRGDIK